MEGEMAPAVDSWFFLVPDMRRVVRELLPPWPRLSLALTCRAAWAEAAGTLLAPEAMMRPRDEGEGDLFADDFLAHAVPQLVNGITPGCLIAWAERLESDARVSGDCQLTVCKRVYKHAIARSGLWYACAHAGWPLHVMEAAQTTRLRMRWYADAVGDRLADFELACLLGYAHGGHAALFEAVLTRPGGQLQWHAQPTQHLQDWYGDIVAYGHASFLPTLRRLEQDHGRFVHKLARAIFTHASWAMWCAAEAADPGFAACVIQELRPEGLFHAMVYEPVRRGGGGFDHRLLNVLGLGELEDPRVQTLLTRVFTNGTVTSTMSSSYQWLRWARRLTRMAGAGSVCTGAAHALDDLQWLHTRGLLDGPALMEDVVFATREEGSGYWDGRSTLSMPREAGAALATVWLVDTPCTAFLWERGYYAFPPAVMRPAAIKVVLGTLPVVATPGVRAWLAAHPFPGSDQLLAAAQRPASEARVALQVGGSDSEEEELSMDEVEDE